MAAAAPQEKGGPFLQNASLSLGLSGSTGNWNPLVNAASPAVQTVAQAVLPAVWTVTSTGGEVLNTSLVTSATIKGQTITYVLNPEAQWSTGAPVSVADFAYTWQADSGSARWKDRGGKAFRPATTNGYSDIASVSAAGTSPAKEVVVQLIHPDPDWDSLFSPLLPASTAAKGFNGGLSSPLDLPSAGPYVVQSWTPGSSVTLVRNAAWWGAPPNLSAVRIAFTPTVSAVNSLAAGQLGMVEPPYSSAVASDLLSMAGVTTQVTPSTSYDDLVFNERSSPLNLAAVRAALTASIDRNGLQALAAEQGFTRSSLVLNRTAMPGSVGFVNHAGMIRADLRGAQNLLREAGISVSPNGSTLHGHPITLKLLVGSTSPFAGAETSAVVAGAKSLGISVKVTTSSADVATGMDDNTYQLALVTDQVTDQPGSLIWHYQATNSLAGYQSATMNSDVSGLKAATTAGQQQEIAGSVDRLAWADDIDLPLLFVPQLTAADHSVENIHPDPYSVGVGWNLSDWGVPSS